MFTFGFVDWYVRNKIKFLNTVYFNLLPSLLKLLVTIKMYHNMSYGTQKEYIVATVSSIPGFILGYKSLNLSNN